METGYIQDAQKKFSGWRMAFRIETWGQVQFEYWFLKKPILLVNCQYRMSNTRNIPIQGFYSQLYLKMCWNSPHLFQNRYKTACCVHPTCHRKFVINKMGVVECREQWRQEGHNAPIKSQWLGVKNGCKTDDNEGRLLQGGERGVKGPFQKVMCGRFFPSLQDTPWPVHGRGLYLNKTESARRC